MPALETHPFTARAIDRLRSEFQNLSDVTLFSDIPKLASEITSLGILREVSGPNDELARFIFDAPSGALVPRESLKAEIIKWNGFTGVRIWSTQSTRLELRTPSFKDLLHPLFSYNDDGTIQQLVLFPEIISRIAKTQGVDTVIVKRWASNTIFGGFDSSKGFYQTNFWELENNDTLLFADLTRKGQVAFLGTHDLIAHICGINNKSWVLLKQQADLVFHAIRNYFKNVDKPSIASMILPYTIGVVLDDLAQPPTYGSASHFAFLDVLLDSLYCQAIAPDLKTILTEFPSGFEHIITGSRNQEIGKDRYQVLSLVETMIAQIKQHTLAVEF